MLKKYKSAFIGITLCVVILTLGLISNTLNVVPVSTGKDFINELIKKGYSIEIMGADHDANESMLFLVKPIRITANEHMIEIYEYKNHIELENFARTISSDGNQIGLNFISWISKPHFFKSGNIIVEYVGENSNIIRDIEKIMGKPFASDQNTRPSPTQTADQEKVVSDLFGDIQNDPIENPALYTDNVFKWSIEYPSEWQLSSPNDNEDTVTPDGDPEQGIFISIGNEAFFDAEDMLYHNQLYVYHFVSHINFYPTAIPYNELKKEEFRTSSHIDGTIMYARKNSNVYIYLTLGEGAFYGAKMVVSEEVFDECHEQIYGILRSIEVEDAKLL